MKLHKSIAKRCQRMLTRGGRGHSSPLKPPCSNDTSQRIINSTYHIDEDCSSIDKAILVPSQEWSSRHMVYHSSRMGTTRRKVSFRDEEMGLTPRHVVTDVFYRPRTTDEEKSELFYNTLDFGTFKQQDLYDRIDQEIQEIERQLESQKANDDNGELMVVVSEEMKMQNLLSRVQRQCNFQHRLALE